MTDPHGQPGGTFSGVDPARLKSMIDSLAHAAETFNGARNSLLHRFSQCGLDIGVLTRLGALGAWAEQLLPTLYRRLDLARDLEQTGQQKVGTLIAVPDVLMSPQEARDRATEAARLAAIPPDEMTTEQFDRLNTLLAQCRGDDIFAEKFATDMGPQRILTMWSGITAPRTDAVTMDREARLGALQQNLGITLGNATRSDSPAMVQWERDMVALGGFQEMSSLLRYGSYDDAFLIAYGNALVTYERTVTNDGRNTVGPTGSVRKGGLPWDGQSSFSRRLNFGPGSGQDAGLDPMTGFMMALSRTPEASTAFFASPLQNNAEWVLEKRPPFPQVGGSHATAASPGGSTAKLNAIGDALVAAATGLGPGQQPVTVQPHTPQQKDVVRNALRHLAIRKDGFPEELRDSMANVLASHGTDTHMTMAGSPEEVVFNRGDLLEVSKQISRSFDSYGILNQGMNVAMLQDVYAEKEHPENSLDRSGRTVGFLEEARRQAIGDKEEKELKEAGWGHVGAGGYLTVASIASFLPYGGGLSANAAFGVSKGLVEDESARIKNGARDARAEVHLNQGRRLQCLADEWDKVNADWARGRTDYDPRHGSWSKIRGAADLGRIDAQGASGR
ncbi:hypothetical protein [Streptomyces sp. 3N207]|uniref:hypothetical protein n=1 Tax=Streptomyces sp. 3N207 TaxID=3457417 RepID=UPI003FD0C1EA